ncbi:unnamed protein product [Lactuca virosa]|uniref:Uncharacterized protein n=1 Tax=Lactuca virosa TaxID=75947 RepID=A0AAU9PE53_9ASTR|nr:unnamed protein product [Lactuca virosa]
MTGVCLVKGTPEISHIRDLIADVTYKDLWLATATGNAQIYRNVFSCIQIDSGFYMPMILATYKICASFDGRSISPCPFEEYLTMSIFVLLLMEGVSQPQPMLSEGGEVVQ